MAGDIVRDLRFALRSLRRTPVLTVAAVVSISLGAGATTAVFSVVDAALLRAPPFDQPAGIVMLYVTRRLPHAAPERERWSWHRFRLLGTLTSSFGALGSYSPAVLTLTGGEAEPVDAEEVSSGYLGVLRVRPIAGRAFAAAEDDGAGAHPVALIGYELWQARYGGDRAMLGRTIGLNGTALTVVGILPPGFAGLSGRAQVWIPATMAPRISYADYLTTNQNFISVAGRMRAGTNLAGVRAELAAAGEALQRAAPSEGSEGGASFSATALALNDARVDPTTRLPLFVLLGSVGCLLLLACANVAGLLLGRAATRRREVAIRVATGASRARVVRQLLVESAAIAACGGALGALLAAPLTAVLGMPGALWRGRNMYGSLGEFADPRVDVRVLLFALTLCAVTTLAFGLVPALIATRLDLSAALKDGPAAPGAAGRGSRLDVRQLIVAAQTSLATALLVTGALLASRWRGLESTNPGFDPDHLLTFQIRPSEVRYPPPAAPALIDRVLEAIRRAPGVEAASVDGCAPLSTGCANSTLSVVGRSAPRAEDAPPVLRHYVGPDYFRALRIPLLRGRVFDAGDRAGGNRVAIINQTAARRFWPRVDPIGQRVWFGGGSNFDRPDSSAEIVGIVADIPYQPMDAHPVQPDFYTPYAQFTYATRMVLVRTRGDPAAAVPAVRRAVAAADPALALFDVETMRERAGRSWARLAYQTRLLAAFAAIALVLAGVGIFAIITHVIGDRRREIAVRIALGAPARAVLAAVGSRGAAPAAVGVAIGVLVSLLAGRVLAALVYGVRGFDPAVTGAATITVITVGVLAAWLAARRALRVEPMEALK